MREETEWIGGGKGADRVIDCDDKELCVRRKDAAVKEFAFVSLSFFSVDLSKGEQEKVGVADCAAWWSEEVMGNCTKPSVKDDLKKVGSYCLLSKSTVYRLVCFLPQLVWIYHEFTDNLSCVCMQ